MSFVGMLQKATAKVESRYFSVLVADAKKPSLRERVYCYELYHQLRKIRKGRTLTLMGEMDKAGHLSLVGFKRPVPDMILHLPGKHDLNQAALEVECRPDKRHLTKDFKTLAQMKANG